MFNKRLIIAVTMICAIAFAGGVTGETSPTFVDNAVTTGAVFVRGVDADGDDNALFYFRATSVTVTAGASGISFSIWDGTGDNQAPTTESWARVLPRLHPALGDTVVTLEANISRTFRFPKPVDMIYVSANGGTIWAE